jgi:general secretion pathway protein G
MMQRGGRGGFTLIEIMVVIVVIGILATFIISSVGSAPDDAKVARARSDIATMTTLIERFRLDMSRYPALDEGLEVMRTPPTSEDAALWKGPYTRSPIPKDPWGMPYEYLAPAPNGIDPFGIESLGADKQPGGEGINADINSWTVYGEEAEPVM